MLKLYLLQTSATLLDANDNLYSRSWLRLYAADHLEKKTP